MNKHSFLVFAFIGSNVVTALLCHKIETRKREENGERMAAYEQAVQAQRARAAERRQHQASR